VEARGSYQRPAPTIQRYFDTFLRPCTCTAGCKARMQPSTMYEALDCAARTRVPTRAVDRTRQLVCVGHHCRHRTLQQRFDPFLSVNKGHDCAGLLSTTLTVGREQRCSLPAIRLEHYAALGTRSMHMLPTMTICGFIVPPLPMIGPACSFKMTTNMYQHTYLFDAQRVCHWMAHNVMMKMQCQ
jgi:hypothetical protein